MELNTLKDLYRHMEWADATVWRSVFASADGTSDPKLRELFYHLHLVQHAYLRAWRGEPTDTAFPTFDDTHAVLLWGRSYYDEVFAHLGTLSDEQVSTTMNVPWVEIVTRELGQSPESISISESVLQVALHSLYHRGQINARLRAVGGEPPAVDFIVWAWLGRPAANWESIPY